MPNGAGDTPGESTRRATVAGDSSRRRLGELCSVIVDAASTPGASWQAIDEAYRSLVDHAGLASPEHDPAVATSTILGGGEAIAPIDAARCIYDVFRTRAFASAVIDEVARRRRADASRPVHVLYAGCGPFAALLLPAWFRFGPDELSCTLIDVHRTTVDAVGRVVRSLGFDGSVRQIAQGDASTYRLPTGQCVDVIVAECLQRGLSREPQVTIVRNLVNQTGPETTLIPQRISLSLVRAGPDAGRAEPRQPLVRVAEGVVFTLDAEAARRWGPVDGDQRLPARTATIETAVHPPAQLALATTIDVGARHSLHDYESGLTSPHPIADAPTSITPGTTLHLAYDSSLPGIVVGDVS